MQNQNLSHSIDYYIDRSVECLKVALEHKQTKGAKLNIDEALRLLQIVKGQIKQL